MRQPIVPIQGAGHFVSDIDAASPLTAAGISVESQEEPACDDHPFARDFRSRLAGDTGQRPGFDDGAAGADSAVAATAHRLG